MRILFVLAFCCFTVTLSAQGTFRISSLMGPGDQQSIGIEKLTPDEQAALEAWVNLWTIKTINQVLSMGCQCTTQDCLNALFQNTAAGQIPEQMPSDRSIPFQRPTPLRKTDSVKKIEEKDFSTITDVLRSGGNIRLDNGGVWETSPGFQAQASGWRRGDKVQLRASTVYGRYVLYNLTRKQQIEVTQPGDPMHTDPYRSDPLRTDLYRAANTFNLKNNLNEGEIIMLDNGATFEIRLSDRRKYTRYWHPGMQIEVGRKGGLYPFSLKVLENGDTVEAKLKN